MCSLDFFGDEQDLAEGRKVIKTIEQRRSDVAKALILFRGIDLDKAYQMDSRFRVDIAAVIQKLERTQSKNTSFDDDFHTCYWAEQIDGFRRKMITIKLALYDEA